jgi:undecaprenyl diphosphate synthase
MNYEGLKIPNHVAIILDGNGRWAQNKGLTRSLGHKAGFDNLKKLSLYVFDKGIKYLSVYAFSTENFKRSIEEVSFLMNLFIEKFNKEFQAYKKENIKVVFSGRREGLREDVLMAMDKITSETANNTKGVFNICLNYGSQYEIVDAVKSIIKDRVDEEYVTIDLLNTYMYQDLPSIDLMIRTSGEYRLSNFMLWQMSYAEFYFPNVHFPDFNNEEFDKAILEYTKRDRRFGGIKYENKSN